jgi:hypothetical protein
MGTVNKFVTPKLLDASNQKFNGQERVNAEIFTAIEILGRKLERTESERDRLARRLALMESAATVDETTGKLYLPVVVNSEAAPYATAQGAAKWTVMASLMSSAIALFALGIVLFRAPEPVLTRDQVATLEALKGTQFTKLMPDSGAWKNVNDSSEMTTPEVAANTVVPNPEIAAAVAANAANSNPMANAEVVNAETTTAPVVTETTAPVVAAEQMPIPLTTPPTEKLAEAAPVEVKPAPVRVVKETQVKKAEPKKTVITATIAHDASLPEKLTRLETRAFEGVPEAQHDLATLYAAGKLVAQNYPRAIYWFTKAADGGVANAHYNMGVIYHQGLGVKADMTLAMTWYEKAAELGHPEAMYNLGIAYIEGVGTKQNLEKGISYFKRAANAGVTQAAYNLGVLYESNFIGHIDMAKAQEWYQTAAHAGHADAQKALERLKDSHDVADSGLTVADTTAVAGDAIEPSSGEEYGEGDASSKAEENKNSLVFKIQQKLFKAGVFPSRPNGIMSPQTEDLIRSYQKKLGMPVDGTPSQALLEKM